MTLEFSLAYFVAVFIFSITPGPGVFALIAKALKNGGHGCWGLALGMTVSDIVYLLLVVWGLAYIASEYQIIFTLIRWCGAAYLFYLSWQVWHAPIDLSIVDLTPIRNKAAGFMLSFAEGMLIFSYQPQGNAILYCIFTYFCRFNPANHSRRCTRCWAKLYCLNVGVITDCLQCK